QPSCTSLVPNRRRIFFFQDISGSRSLASGIDSACSQQRLGGRDQAIVFLHTAVNPRNHLDVGGQSMALDWLLVGGDIAAGGDLQAAVACEWVGRLHRSLAVGRPANDAGSPMVPQRG